MPEREAPPFFAQPEEISDEPEELVEFSDGLQVRTLSLTHKFLELRSF